MTSTVQVEETTLSDLLSHLKAGDEIILTQGSEHIPIARVEGIARSVPPSRRLGFLEHLKVDVPDSLFFDPLPNEELRLWEEGDPDDPLYTGVARP